MAQLVRVEVFSADEVAVVHVISNFLKRFAAAFGIDLLSFASLSNRFHLILRSRPDVVATWDDTEVARSSRERDDDGL